jgi:hypothetical protein
MTNEGLLTKFGFMATLLMMIGCVEPYPAPDIGENISILVVDGFINATDGSATVRLTKAVALTKTDGYPTEKGADVTIRSENGDSFKLVEQDSGEYFATGFEIDTSTKYQLNIHTSDNRDIVSDYISIMQTPPIDSVRWRPERGGISILVSTHDQNESSRYYHWDFIETWEYRAPYPSPYRNVNNTVITLSPGEYPYTCYRTLPSTKITVASTSRLSDDVVRDFPLTYIEGLSSRLSVLYSINVRQRVIGKNEYDYMLDLQRVTESVGGLFDSQPYEILGNIRSTDPSVPVLGYFSAGTVDEQRIFVRFTDLPEYLQKVPYHGCPLDTVCSVLRPDLRCTIDLESLPDNSYLVAKLDPAFPGYTRTSRACADCRVQGGVLTKPDFWP